MFFLRSTLCCHRDVISHKVFFKSICISQLPQKSVNLSFTIIYMQNKLTNLCGNWHLQNDFKNALCEMRTCAVGGQAGSGRALLAYLSQGVLKPFCRSQLPHNSVNISFTITNMKNKSTELCENWRISRQICVGIDFCRTNPKMLRVRWGRLQMVVGLGREEHHSSPADVRPVQGRFFKIHTGL